MFVQTSSADASAVAECPFASWVAASWYSSIANGGRRCRGVLERVGGDPRSEGRLELGTEALLVENGEIVLVAEPRINPCREEGDVDLRLGVGETRRSGRLDLARRCRR